jgi:hypothetical protein
LPGHFGVIVDVHFDEANLALGGANQLLDNWRELLAWSAPGGPEVDQDRHGFGRLDNILHEALGRGILDQLLAAADHAGISGDRHGSWLCRRNRC